MKKLINSVKFLKKNNKEIIYPPINKCYDKPHLYTLISPSGDKMICVKALIYNILGDTYTRLSNADPGGEIKLVNEQWIVYDTSFNEFKRKHKIVYEIVKFKNNYEMVYVLNNNGHRVVLSGLECGRILYY